MSNVGAQRGVVLVTGASTGIGRSTARLLAGRGFEVLAGVRRDVDADALGEVPGVRPLRLEVTSAEDVAAAVGVVEEATGGSGAGAVGLAGLVNNAGIAVAGPVEVTPLEEWRRQLEVNVVGQVGVTQALLPALRRARGRVVFTGSMAGSLALPGLGPYAASKHALEAVADSLRREVARQGVRVSLLQPGSIATPIWGKGLEEVPRLRESFGEVGRSHYGRLLDALEEETGHQERIAIPAEKVAAAALHALTARRPRHRYVVGKDALAAVRVLDNLPSGLVDRLVARQLKL